MNLAPPHMVSATPPELKCCRRCKEEKPLDAFGRSSREQDGLRPECKACRKTEYLANADRLRAKQTAYYQDNRAARQEAQRQYNQRNRDAIGQRARARYAAMSPAERERVYAANRRWTAANREKVRADLGRWRAENADRIRESGRARWLGREAERNAFERALRRRNPGWEKAKKHARRARLKAAVGRFYKEQWHALCDACGHVCLDCGQHKPLTPDHVVPISKGGSNDIGNIQPLCHRCNSRKGARTIDFRSDELRELIALNTWPQKWKGDEPTGDVPLDAHFSDGTVQPLLVGVFD